MWYTSFVSAERTREWQVIKGHLWRSPRKSSWLSSFLYLYLLIHTLLCPTSHCYYTHRGRWPWPHKHTCHLPPTVHKDTHTQTALTFVLVSKQSCGRPHQKWKVGWTCDKDNSTDRHCRPCSKPNWHLYCCAQLLVDSHVPHAQVQHAQLQLHARRESNSVAMLQQVHHVAVTDTQAYDINDHAGMVMQAYIKVAGVIHCA